jgi:cysteine-rich repeat protein
MRLSGYLLLLILCLVSPVAGQSPNCLDPTERMDNFDGHLFFTLGDPSNHTYLEYSERRLDNGFHAFMRHSLEELTAADYCQRHTQLLGVTPLNYNPYADLISEEYGRPVVEQVSAQIISKLNELSISDDRCIGVHVVSYGLSGSLMLEVFKREMVPGGKLSPLLKYPVNLMHQTVLTEETPERSNDSLPSRDFQLYRWFTPDSPFQLYPSNGIGETPLSFCFERENCNVRSWSPISVYVPDPFMGYGFEWGYGVLTNPSPFFTEKRARAVEESIASFQNSMCYVFNEASLCGCQPGMNRANTCCTDCQAQSCNPFNDGRPSYFWEDPRYIDDILRLLQLKLTTKRLQICGAANPSYESHWRSCLQRAEQYNERIQTQAIIKGTIDYCRNVVGYCPGMEPLFTPLSEWTPDLVGLFRRAINRAPGRLNGPAPFCGDGSKGPSEDCDNGPMNGDDQLCKSDCTRAACGDGHVQAVAGESCDDGNKRNGDGCSSMCQLENSCGNGILEPHKGEECDYGNGVAGLCGYGRGYCRDCKCKLFSWVSAPKKDPL